MVILMGGVAGCVPNKQSQACVKVCSEVYALLFTDNFSVLPLDMLLRKHRSIRALWEKNIHLPLQITTLFSSALFQPK